MYITGNLVLCIQILKFICSYVLTYEAAVDSRVIGLEICNRSNYIISDCLQVWL